MYLRNYVGQALPRHAAIMWLNQLCFSMHHSCAHMTARHHWDIWLHTILILILLSLQS